MNGQLGTRLADQSLIKTKVYVAVDKKKNRSEFMEGFGIGAKVADELSTEDHKKAASDILRTSNMTDC